MESGEIIYQKVDDFIKKLHEKNIKLNAKAQSIMITETKGKDTWGKPIKESHSLAELIGKKMASYQRIKNSELIVDSLLKHSEENASSSLEATKEFIRDIHIRSATNQRKDDVANELFRYIEIAYTNDVIDEIGLGNKLKRLEEENTSQKKLIASLEKLNKDLKKETESLHKYIPNYKKRDTEVGDVSV
jgi:hypothetical protein